MHFYYNETELEIVSSFKYLGVVFTSGGSFNETDKLLSGQSLKAIFKLNQYINKFAGLSPGHILDLFDKLISPILNYAGEVWGFNKGLQVERSHLSFCKRTLGVKKSTQNSFIYGETGRLDCINRRYFLIIKYWLKVCTSNESKYIKAVYNVLRADSERHPNTVNWASQVKQLLSITGFYNVWLNQGVGEDEMFLKIFKQRLKDNFIQKWNADLNNSSRAIFYKTFASFDFKLYLNVINISKYREAFTRLRVSSHRLEVEVGRWAKPNSIPFDNRLCRQCGVLEDEYHFLIECKSHIDIRKQYIKSYFWKHPSFLKCLQLINSTNVTELKRLSVFIYKAFEIRRILNTGS